jgi:hypothetical protein
MIIRRQQPLVDWLAGTGDEPSAARCAHGGVLDLLSWTVFFFGLDVHGTLASVETENTSAVALVDKKLPIWWWCCVATVSQSRMPSCKVPARLACDQGQ